MGRQQGLQAVCTVLRGKRLHNTLYLQLLSQLLHRLRSLPSEQTSPAVLAERPPSEPGPSVASGPVERPGVAVMRP